VNDWANDWAPLWTLFLIGALVWGVGGMFLKDIAKWWRKWRDGK
jgi:hypothetical protein